MAMIPEHIIDEVKNATDIVAVIEQHLELKRAGSAYKGLCPFHDDTNPSMHVNPQRQSFKCFVCGEGGSVFTFIQRFRNITFPEAVRELARERGIEVPRAGRQVPQAPKGHLDSLRDALRLAQRFFVHSLGTPAGEEARRYLERRGYDASAIERFGLGYAPAAFDALINAAGKRGIRAEVLANAGVAKPRQRGGGFYDTFRNRVIFPVRDRMGRVCTFGARALSDEDEPKYLNGPETEVFKKSQVLFGMDISREGLRRHGHALLMEGYTDVLAAHLAGYDCAVAGMGTAFTEQQATMLSRATTSVVLVYDGDAAGQAAAERTIDILLPTGVEVRVVSLPLGQDVDDVIREAGAEAFGDLIQGATPFLDFKLARLGERHDMASTHGRARAAEELVATISKVKSRMEQSQLLSLLSQPSRLGIDLVGAGGEQLLRRALGDAHKRDERLRRSRGRGKGRGREPGARDRRGGAAGRQPRRLGRPQEGLVLINRRLRAARGKPAAGRTRDELRWIQGAMSLPGLQEELMREVGPDDFSDPVRARLWEHLLERYEHGEVLDHDDVQRAFVADAEIQGVLAGFFDEPELEELVRRQLQHLCRTRLAARQIEDLRERGILETRRPESSPVDVQSEDSVPPMLAEPPESAESGGFRAPAEDELPEVVWELEDTSSLAAELDASPEAGRRGVDPAAADPDGERSPAVKPQPASAHAGRAASTDVDAKDEPHRPGEKDEPSPAGRTETRSEPAE